MILIIRYIVFCLAVFLPAIVLASALSLPRNESGWTIFTPSSDSRIMYVAADGNDGTGVVYTNANHPDWSNPQNPSGAINAFATYSAAFANARDGYPDWILFKRGDTFVEDRASNNTIGGRNISEPSLIGAYGSSGLSPLLKVGDTYGIDIRPGSGDNNTRRYMAVQGIRFYAHTRNPDDPGYIGNDGEDGIKVYGHYISNILIEGCAFMYFANNTIQGVAGYDRVKDIDIRRTLFLHSYNSVSHAQGLYGHLVDNVLIEECVFDHNGWLIQSYDGTEADGQAVIFNHNTYFSAHENFIFRNNISARPSSIHNKHSGEYDDAVNSIHDNNLYIDGEIGLDYAGNHADEEIITADGLEYRNNVLYKIGLSNSTDRGISWGLSLTGIGNTGGNVYNNIILNNGLPNGFYLLGFYLPFDSTDLNIYDNIIYGHTENGNLFTHYGAVGDNVNIYNNYFRSFAGASGNYVYTKVTGLTGYAFTNNTYYGESDFNIDGSDYSESYWQTNIEPTASFEQITYTDDTRTVESYLISIGETGTLNNFYDLIRAQDRYSWDGRLMADPINDYIRTGFDMEEYIAFTTSILTGQTTAITTGTTSITTEQ